MSRLSKSGHGGDLNRFRGLTNLIESRGIKKPDTNGSERFRKKLATNG